MKRGQSQKTQTIICGGVNKHALASDHHFRSLNEQYSSIGSVTGQIGYDIVESWRGFSYNA